MYWNKMRARLTGDVPVKETKVPPPPLSSRRVETEASKSSTGATDLPVRVLQEKLLSPWAGSSQCHLFSVLGLRLRVQCDPITSCLRPLKRSRFD